MKRTILLLALCFMLTAVVSCKKTDKSSKINAPDESRTDLTAEELGDPEPALEISRFDCELIEYLNSHGYYYKDLVISPAAFRASLCLGAIRAQNDTQKEMLTAAGFSDMNELEAWLAGYCQGADLMSAESRSGAFLSVWEDSKLMGDFTASYSTAIQEKYAAEAISADAANLREEISGWLSNKTQGEISSIPIDVTDASSVLMSTVCMQLLWDKGFTETEGAVQKTGEFWCAHKDGTDILKIQIGRSLSLLIFAGGQTNFSGDLPQFKRETLRAILPQFEIESHFDANVFKNFMSTKGISSPFESSTAEFDGICENGGWFIQELLQSAKLSINVSEAPQRDSDEENSHAVREYRTDGMISFALFGDLGSDKQQLLLYGQLHDK